MEQTEHNDHAPESESPEKTPFSFRAKRALKEIILYLSENAVIFAASFAAFVISSLYSFGVIHNTDWTKAVALSCIFAIPVTFLSRSFSPVKKYAIQIGAALAGFLLGYFSASGFGNFRYGDLYYYGIAGAVISFSIFLFMPKHNSRAYFTLVLKQFFFCALLSIVFFLGLLLLTYAVQNLILGTSNYDVYESCLAFSFFVVAINSFAYHLFYKRAEASSGKAFKVVVLYIALPVFFTLILVLYAYLIKALVLFSLPNGEINWFVSCASCIFIVFYFILREYDALFAVRLFYRFGAFAFIPLVVVQVAAFSIRVNAYGFTSARVASLLFIIFSCATISLTFIKKGKFSPYSLVLLSAFILFGSLSPFNVKKVAYKNQMSRMISVMKKYGMYDAQSNSLTAYDRAFLEEDISDKDRETLYGAFRYITFGGEIGERPKWLTQKDADGKDQEIYNFEDAFGIKSEAEKENMLSFSWEAKFPEKTIDIAPFKEMKRISVGLWSDKIVGGTWNEYADEYPSIQIQTKNGEYDVTDFLFKLPQKEQATDAPLWYFPDEKTAFCFTEIEYEYNKDRALFKHCALYGYVFYK